MSTVSLNAMQEELCTQTRWDLSDLSAVFINCTLKRPPERSHTQGLIDISASPGRRRWMARARQPAGGMGCRLPFRLRQSRAPLIVSDSWKTRK